MKLQSYNPNEKLNTINAQVANTGSAEAYGADTSGNSALQNALNRAADTWLAIDKQNDQVKAIQANNDIIRYSNDLLHNTETGLMNQKGMNAQTILPSYTDAMEKKRQEVLAQYNFKTRDSINAFGKMVDNTLTDNIDMIDRYQRSQYEDSIQTANNNTLELLSNNLQLADNFDSQQKTLDLMGSHVEATGKMLGQDDAQIQAAKGKLYNSQAEALLNQSQMENNLDKMDKFLQYFTGKADEGILTKYRNASKKMNEAKWGNNTEQFEYIYKINRDNPEQGAKMAAEAARARAAEQGSSGVSVANQNLWNVAQILQRKYNIDSNLVYEQMMHETGGGTSELAKYHNYGGLKTSSDTGLNVPADELEGSGGLNWYASFQSDEEYADAIAKTLVADNLQGVHDRHTYAQKLKDSGYYTDSVENYENGMASFAPKKKSFTEDELNNVYKDAYNNFLSFASQKRQMEGVAAQARINTLKTAVNDAIMKGDYSTATSLISSAEAAAQTPEEKATISAMGVSANAALQKQVAETQKLTPMEEYSLKEYARDHSMADVLNKVQDMGKTPSESFMVQVAEIQDKRGTIASTDYSGVGGAFSGLKGAALDGAKYEYAIRVSKAQQEGYVSDYQKQEIANDVAVEHSAKVSGSGIFFNDDVPVSAAVSRANNWNQVITDNGDGTVVGVHPDGSTEVMTVSEYKDRYNRTSG